jgi:hypothetical protein
MSTEPHEDHGHSPAAWTLVVMVMVGSLVASIAVVAASETGFFIGIGIVVLGCVVGKVMQMMASAPETAPAGSQDPAQAA